MISSQTTNEFLRRAFAPTTGGIVGLTDQLLAACVGGNVELKRVGDRCVCSWTVSGQTQEALAPVPPAAFRTILARIAALCAEHNSNVVSPYGGEGLLTVKGQTPTVVRVTFVNTSKEQRLEVRGHAEGSHQSALLDSQTGAPNESLQPTGAANSVFGSSKVTEAAPAAER